MRPEKELKGLAKGLLEAGETRTVTWTLDCESLAYYDDLAQQWVAEAGGFEVLVGGSSQDIGVRVTLNFNASRGFGGPGKAATELSIESPLLQLLVSEAAGAMSERHLLGMGDSPQFGMMPNRDQQLLGEMASRFVR